MSILPDRIFLQILFPSPGGGHHLVDAKLRFPAQLGGVFGNISPYADDVSVATRATTIIKLSAGCFFQGGDRFYCRIAFPGTYIEHIAIAIWIPFFHPADGGDVRFG